MVTRQKDLDNLKNGIKEFWKALMPTACIRCFYHLLKVILVIIKKNGEPSGYYGEINFGL